MTTATKTSPRTYRSVPSIVDRMGTLKSVMAQAREEYDKLYDRLTQATIVRDENQEVSKMEPHGELFKAVILRKEVSRVDYKTIVTVLNPDKRLIRKYTTVRPEISVTISAR